MEQQPRPNDDTIMTMTSNITTFPYKRAHSVLALGNLDSHFKFKLPDITFLKVELNTSRMNIRPVDLFSCPLDYVLLKVECLEGTQFPDIAACLFMQATTIDSDPIASVKHKHTSYGSPERLRGF
jgi:hypothetical protein